MHAALLIDEILQLVFDFCADLPKTEPKWTFAQLARCCRAWKDPAFDRLWARLTGVEPLLALLPKGHEPVSLVVQCKVRIWSETQRRLATVRRNSFCVVLGQRGASSAYYAFEDPSKRVRIP